MKNMDFGKYKFIDYTNLTPEEIELVLTERNKNGVRQWMNKSDLISWDDHINFIKSLKSNKSKRYWLVKRNNNSVGAVYIVDIDTINKEGIWGYYIFEQFQGLGWGIDLEFFALAVFFKYLKLNNVLGYVDKNNLNSLSLQPIFNFKKAGENNNQVILKLSKEDYNCIPNELMEFKIKNIINNGKT